LIRTGDGVRLDENTAQFWHKKLFYTVLNQIALYMLSGTDGHYGVGHGWLGRTKKIEEKFYLFKTDVTRRA
jgi:hypothetical protein